MELKMTVGEFRERMTVRELMQWMVFIKLRNAEFKSAKAKPAVNPKELRKMLSNMAKPKGK